MLENILTHVSLQTPVVSINDSGRLARLQVFYTSYLLPHIDTIGHINENKLMQANKEMFTNVVFLGTRICFYSISNNTIVVVGWDCLPSHSALMPFGEH